MHGKRSSGISELRRLAIALAAAWFAILQIVLVAHAASPHALSPDHDATACIYCVGVGPGGSAPSAADPGLPSDDLAITTWPPPNCADKKAVFNLTAAPRGPPAI